MPDSRSAGPRDCRRRSRRCSRCLPLRETKPQHRNPPQIERNRIGSLANFAGAYVDNALSEMQETWIDLDTNEDAQLAAVEIAAVDLALRLPAPDVARSGEISWWLQTTFHLPFMYTIGAEPAFDEHTVLVFPMLDPARVKDLRAWVNGEPLDVRRYAYPRNRGLSTWWADLVGTAARGGDNTLVVHVDFGER